MGECWGWEEMFWRKGKAGRWSGSGGWPWAVGGFDVEAEEAAGSAGDGGDGEAFGLAGTEEGDTGV